MPSKKKKYESRFPPARVKKIMQSDEQVGKVAHQVPIIVCEYIGRDVFVLANLIFTLFPSIQNPSKCSQIIGVVHPEFAPSNLPGHQATQCSNVDAQPFVSFLTTASSTLEIVDISHACSLHTEKRPSCRWPSLVSCVNSPPPFPT